MNCIVCAIIPLPGPIRADVIVDGNSMCMPHVYKWLSYGQDQGLMHFIAREKSEKRKEG